MSSAGAKKSSDPIKRGVKDRSLPGTASFFGSRVVEPYLQYGILAKGWGDPLITAFRGTILSQAAPFVTNTAFDRLGLGLSPYRSILFGMAVGAMLKQNFHLLAIMQEEMGPGFGLTVGVANAVANSINSLLFIYAQTSASANGEHFPQIPLIVGSTMYIAGLFVEWFSEVQRAAWKRKPENTGKIYAGGLFGWSRHIKYLGYTLWRSGYALAAGGWVWGTINAALATYHFTRTTIPLLQDYLQKRVCWQTIILRTGRIRRELANRSTSTASNTITTRKPSLTSSCLWCGRADCSARASDSRSGTGPAFHSAMYTPTMLKCSIIHNASSHHHSIRELSHVKQHELVCNTNSDRKQFGSCTDRRRN